MPEQIVSHIYDKYCLSYDKPLQIVCKFRRKNPDLTPKIDLKRHFKNNLKASTAIRYGIHGASRLTVSMSINNVDSMYEAFSKNNIHKYNGTSNF